MKRTREITNVKYLSSGYVRVNSSNTSRYWGWAQMPREVWDTLTDGEAVPSEYVFANECPDAMPILVKKERR